MPLRDDGPPRRTQAPVEENDDEGDGADAVLRHKAEHLPATLVMDDATRKTVLVAWQESDAFAAAEASPGLVLNARQYSTDMVQQVLEWGEDDAALFESTDPVLERARSLEGKPIVTLLESLPEEQRGKADGECVDDPLQFGLGGIEFASE